MNNERAQVQGFFYSDKNPKSQEARELLNSTGLVFIERIDGEGLKFEPGFIPPVLQTPEGDFRGLEGIKMFVALKSK